MNDLRILKNSLRIAEVHAKRLQEARKKVEHILPLTAETFSELHLETLGLVEMVLHRFAKLQDLFGSQIFPVLLKLLQEDAGLTSALDRLNKLEKLTIIPSMQIWIDMRNDRNYLAHEYEEDSEQMVIRINRIIRYADVLLKLLETVGVLVVDIEKKLTRYSLPFG